MPRLDAVQAGDRHAGRPALEIRHRQAQQMAQHAGCEHRVHPVTGVDDEVLPHPAHRGVEGEEDRQAAGDDDERARALVHDDLVDDHLREERRPQADQHDRRRGDQDVAPDRAVLEDLRGEPAEAESALLRLEAGDLVLARLRRRGEDDGGLECGVEFVQGERARLVAAGLEVQHLLRVGAQEERGRCSSCAPHESESGERDRRDFLCVHGGFADPEPCGAKRLQQPYAVVRRRKLPEQQRFIEGKAGEPVQAGEKPDEMLPGDLRPLRRCRAAHPCPP